MHTWSHQTAKVLLSLAAAGIAVGAVAEAAEERLNPGAAMICHGFNQVSFLPGPAHMLAAHLVPFGCLSSQ